MVDNKDEYGSDVDGIFNRAAKRQKEGGGMFQGHQPAEVNPPFNPATQETFPTRSSWENFLVRIGKMFDRGK